MWLWCFNKFNKTAYCTTESIVHVMSMYWNTWSIFSRLLTSLQWQLCSVLESSTTKIHKVYSVVLEETKTLQLVGQLAEFKFESKFEPDPVILPSLQKSIPIVGHDDNCFLMKIKGFCNKQEYVRDQRSAHLMAQSFHHLRLVPIYAFYRAIRFFLSVSQRGAPSVCNNNNNNHESL